MRSSIHEPAWVLTRAPGGARGGSCHSQTASQRRQWDSGDKCLQDEPSLKGPCPSDVCQGSFGTGVCQRVGKLVGLKNGLRTALLRGDIRAFMA